MMCSCGRCGATEYPVGRCADQACSGSEPHRHGFACDLTCECAGVGAETESLTEFDLQECDWGDCDRDCVAVRRDYCGTDQAWHCGYEMWLSVCAWHAGWEDEPS